MNIYIVDDDADLRKSLAILFRRLDHQVQEFASATAFLSVADDLTPGCVLLDVRMPGMDGLAAQSALTAAHSPHSIILLTGFGEVPQAVRAMRAGAVDFLSKPCRREALLDAVSRAEEALSKRLAQRHRTGRTALLDTLSAKERAVLAASAGGKGSKQVAHDMQLSVRTVEMHRSNIIKKLAVQNFAGALLLVADQQANS